MEACVRVLLTSSVVGAVLSDKRKRTLYDAGLDDPDDEQDEVGISEKCLSLFPRCILIL